MKNIKTFSILILILIISIIACQKSDTPMNGVPQPTINSTYKFFSNQMAKAIQSNTVDVSTSPVLPGNQGSMIQINSNSFIDAYGNQVTGNVDIELIEAFDNSDMLMLNLPTVTNNGELLNSGGVVWMNATQNGEQLQLSNSLTATIPVNNTITNAALFFGETNTAGDFVWTQDTSNVTGDTANWQVSISNLNWVNIDVLAFPPGTEMATEVSVVLPNNIYDGTNTTVFMYFDNINSCLALNCSSPGKFSLSVPIAVGESVKFGAMANIDNQWSFGFTPSALILDQHTDTITYLNPMADQQALEIAISNAL